MLFQASAVVGFLIGVAASSPVQPSKRESNAMGESIGINSDSMISYDGIYFGFAPTYNPATTMATLNGDTGQKAATYNVYSQLTNSVSYDGNGQYNVDDIISSGAVLIASLMPTEVYWTDMKPALCQSIMEYFTNTFTSKGVTVWLRFAHEVNYYVTVGTYQGGNNPSEYLTAWQNMYAASQSDDKILMHWSPNDDTTSEPVAPWWPGSEYVDIVGVDYYPNADDGLPDFQTAYGSFYNTYAAQQGLPFAIGETGTQLSTGASASIEQREQWLTAVINPSGGFGNYPNYVSCTWFEYNSNTQGPDFTVVIGQPSSVVQQTISNTENGS